MTGVTELTTVCKIESLSTGVQLSVRLAYEQSFQDVQTF